MTILAVHSPKGGTGSTFVASRLAMQFAERGRPVSIVDFSGQDSLKLQFGITPDAPLGNPDGFDAEGPVVLGVRLMKCGRFRGAISACLQTLSTSDSDELIILDIDSGDVETMAEARKIADLHLCVTEPTPSALASLAHLNEAVAATSIPNLAIVLNKVDDRFKLSRHCRSFLADLFRQQFLGVVRRDEAVNEALAMFEPLNKYAPNSVVLPDMAALAVALEERLAQLSAPERRQADQKDSLRRAV